MRGFPLICFLLCLLWISPSFSAERRLNSSQLLTEMYGECLALCSNITRMEFACPTICDFVNHLFNHDKTIFDTYTNLYYQDTDVADYSLKDTIEYAMKSQEDDPHKLSLKFRDTLIRWGEEKRNKVAQ